MKSIIAICGHGDHGKGTVASYVALKTGRRYRESTSQAAARVVFAALKDKYGYKTVQEAWDDRRNHREEWADIIWEYNEPDGLTLYREMLADNDILEGVRRASEFQALKTAGMVQTAIWVDASKRKPPEGPGSCQITPEDCDHIVDNNGDLDDLKVQLDLLVKNLSME